MLLCRLNQELFCNVTPVLLQQKIKASLCHLHVVTHAPQLKITQPANGHKPFPTSHNTGANLSRHVRTIYAEQEEDLKLENNTNSSPSDQLNHPPTPKSLFSSPAFVSSSVCPGATVTGTPADRQIEQTPCNPWNAERRHGWWRVYVCVYVWAEER